MNLSILLALVTTTRALSPRCLEYCWLKFSRQSSLPWNPRCNCFAEENETAPVSKATLRRPAELYPAESVLYFDQPFYIINPIVKVFPKHFKLLKDVKENNPKVHESKFTRERETMKHVKDDEILLEKLNTSKHFGYLDVNVDGNSIEGRSSGQTSHSSQDLHQMEKILSQCMDLHILSLSRKHNNVSTLLKLWGPSKFQRLNNLSDRDLTKAIENECREPENYVTNSLGEIINKWPKRPIKPVANTSNNGGNDDLHLLNGTKPQATVLLLRNNSDSYQYTSDLKTDEIITTSTDNKTSNHPTAKVMDRQLPAEDIEAHKLENVKDHDSNSHLGKALSARSTDETHNTPVKSDLLLPSPPFSTVTEGLTITQMDEIVVKKNEDEDLLDNTNVSSIQKQMFDIAKKDSVNLGAWEEDKGYTSHSDKNNNFTRRQNSLETFREYLNHHDIRNISLNIMAPYLISKKHATANQSDPSTGPHNNNSEDIVNNTSLGNERNPMFLSQTHYEDKDKNITIIYAETHKTFNESEFSPQKIITREFANNTVVSIINGNEDVHNNDFLYSSNEDTTAQKSILSLKIKGESNDNNDDLAEALVKNIANSVNNNPKAIESVINGRLYFLFGQEPIPARFLQKSDGELHVGIDGQTLCMKLNEEQVNKSKILAALCNCTQFNNCSVTQNRT